LDERRHLAAAVLDRVDLREREQLVGFTFHYADGHVRGRKLRIALLGGMCVLLAAPASAGAISRARLEHGLSEQMRRVGGGSGAWVYDLDAAKRGQLFSWASKTPRILASNSKLFTTATALHRLGPDTRLVTRLYPQPRSSLRPHEVGGNLVIVGDGDPALASQAFAKKHGLPLTPLAALAKKLKSQGIKRVLGKIEADDTIFDRRRGIPTTGVQASPGDMNSLSGLSYNEGLDGSHDAHSPELQAARALRAKLRHRGIHVKGGVSHANLSSGALGHAPLATVRSPQIANLVTATNRPSNNFYAEMLLKRLAASPTKKGTTSRGARLAEHFAKTLGAPVRMENGSGLTRRNQASPKSVGHLLRAMTRQPEGRVFRRSLPLAGHQGTLSDRMGSTAANGKCRAKTGTLISVSALSGYCRTGRGMVAFSILMNSIDLSVAQDAQDKMASLISQYGR
jgi:serine-type D-Ala-D-Ala carboxypeptidase/endopeptidase (penicillin-binding protein 4)